jgi:Ras-related protein Rab-8A
VLRCKLAGVGKSCLILRYTTNKFSTSYITTIGIDFKTKRVDIGGKSVQLDVSVVPCHFLAMGGGTTALSAQIWDTAGQERFQTITLSYLRGAKGIMLVYDVTDVASFEQTRSWMKSIHAVSAAAMAGIPLCNVYVCVCVRSMVIRT